MNMLEFSEIKYVKHNNVNCYFKYVRAMNVMVLG
jgi:hypothetical protein